MAINSSSFGVFGITILFFLSNVAIINATEPIEQSTTEYPSRCEKLSIKLCELNMPYNMTMMPNYLGHRFQEDAGLDVHQFTPLTKSVCKPHLVYYLCLIYAPVCTSSGKILPPCRSLCHDAQDECKLILKEAGGMDEMWPKYLSCDELPDHEANPDAECIGNPKVKLSWSLPPPKEKNQPRSNYRLVRNKYKMHNHD
ncbi:hypothetical protein PV327_005441 [Microctonus hyperodae]|uniref:FZ domain-containing protein n=1 Tax=Microctonus hyperodae TaxID=165561 RepID=A0AA39G1N9_MICHY|nr:hypothetical protein PV327_005441 [Microctonus hyperodae]